MSPLRQVTRSRIRLSTVPHRTTDRKQLRRVRSDVCAQQRCEGIVPATSPAAAAAPIRAEPQGDEHQRRRSHSPEQAGRHSCGVEGLDADDPEHAHEDRRVRVEQRGPSRRRGRASLRIPARCPDLAAGNGRHSAKTGIPDDTSRPRDPRCSSCRRSEGYGPRPRTARTTSENPRRRTRHCRSMPSRTGARATATPTISSTLRVLTYRKVNSPKAVARPCSRRPAFTRRCLVRPRNARPSRHTERAGEGGSLQLSATRTAEHRSTIPTPSSASVSTTSRATRPTKCADAGLPSESAPRADTLLRAFCRPRKGTSPGEAPAVPGCERP